MILMHSRGTPATMTSLCHYDDVVADVAKELSINISEALLNDVAGWMCIADPGIGFAKNSSQNLALMRRLSEFRQHLKDLPVRQL